MRKLILWTMLAASTAAGGCDSDQGDDDGGGGPRECDPSVSVPDGFCAQVFATDLGRVRHLSVTPDGVVFGAVMAAFDGSEPGHVLALRDDDGDGRADRKARFHDGGGNGVVWHDGWLYFAENHRIVRWAMAADRMEPETEAVEIVAGLPDTGDHPAKAIAIADDGGLFVNIASASNACQVDNRVPGSPGLDPCPELGERAGIWRFDAGSTMQTQDSGERWATGVRNATALAIEPGTQVVWAAINGRDQLHDNWPDRFTPDDDLAMPSEEMVGLARGDDLGWPYCFHDPRSGEKLLAPEYGGDGEAIGRCAEATAPDLAFPAHWAPLGLTFYRADAFPARYRGGAFIAFHGSRFEPDAATPPGYEVAFVPFEEGRPAGGRETFLSGFAGDGRPLPDEAEHRAVGVAVGPDGELYVSDDWGGTIWRITAETSPD